MADPIQSIAFPVSYQGTSTQYVANINKQTGAMDVYEQTPLGNRYFILTSYPGNNWKPELAAGALVPGNYNADQKKHILTSVSNAANNQRAAFVNKNYTDTQRQNLFAGMPKVSNVANPSPTPDPVKPTDPAATPVPVVTNINPATEQKANDYGTWIYPTGLGDNEQDYILFEMLEYAGRGDLESLSATSGLSQRKFDETKILGRVVLPIQPTISDINSVDWQNDSINPLQVLGAQLSLKGQQTGYTEADFAKLKTMFADNPDVQSYLQQWFAGKAIGTNIFSRFSGAVVNPNVELLFNGPQLRPFNFSFRLSPRSTKEADQVKGIIRFFKQGMSIRRTSNDLFLKAPNVFKITYRNGQKPKTIGAAEEHTSLNKIKICALSQCSVDYTPDGSYATFYDEESTMTQYGLSLQFNELEPIFNEDYNKLPKTTIGY